MARGPPGKAQMAGGGFPASVRRSRWDGEPVDNFFVRRTPAAVNITPMSDAYRQLLDATIAHLEELRATGRRFVSVAPETLAALSVAAPPALPRPVLTKPAVAPAGAPTTRGVVAPAALPPPVSKPVAPAPLMESQFTGPALDPAAKEGIVVFTNGDGGRAVYERLVRACAGFDPAAFSWI